MMAGEPQDRPLQYRRVVLTVQGGGAPASAFRLAAELAHWLELDLEGVFVEDEALLALAGHSFAREFSLPGHTWQTLNSARMIEDFRNTADQARSLLAEAASSLGIASGFSVLRGDPAMLAARLPASDILVVVEAGGVPGLALRCEAAMMLVPPRPRTTSGAIAVVAEARNGAGLATALALARRAGADLLLILPGDTDVAMPTEGDFPSDRILRRRVPAGDTVAIARAVRAANARLLVIARSTFADDPAAAASLLAAASGVPVLMVAGAAEEKGEAEEKTDTG
jgi:hypothetical protein